MTFSVIVATSNSELSAAIISRLLHPAIGFESIETVPDAIELIALTNSTSPDLVIIDQDLPDLTKGLVKELLRTFQVLVITESANKPVITTRFSRIQVDLSELTRKLGQYRKLVREQEAASKQGQLIAVAAVASASGASSIALNLALALSNQHNVVLVDFDLVHPSLAAQINIKATRGLRQLAMVLPQTDLTPAELEQYFIQVNDSMQFLPGLAAANQITDLDLSSLDEITEVALEMDGITVMDLGQLQLQGSIAKTQIDLIAMSDRLIIVVSADPISVLTSCNWLSSIASRYSNKLEIVINKVQRDVDRPELAKLIKEVTGVLPTAYFPMDAKNFTAAVWTGNPVTLAKPKSGFSRAIQNWIGSNAVSDLSEKEKSVSKLSRLREVS